MRIFQNKTASFCALITLYAAWTSCAQAQLTVLASFDGANGNTPYGGLTLSDGILYGTTADGGTYDHGVVYSLPVSGGAPTLLTSLDFDSSVGSNPIVDLTLSGGILYGATQGGTGSPYGAVFSLPTGGGVPTLLASFNLTDGATPESGLALIGTTLYGTAVSGGTNNLGTVFSIPKTGGTPTVLASFNGTNGSNPQGDLLLNGSTFYGTTARGGANGYGEVFSLPISGGTPTALASFNSANGATPESSLTLIGTTLYGTTSSGGAYNEGTVFSVPVGGGPVTVLASFNGMDGGYPLGDLILSQDGKTLFGTTSGGGASNKGVVFSIPVGGGSPTILADFDSTDGANPSGSLVLSADGGTLFGTTENGGANNDGTVFSISVQVPEPASSALFFAGFFLLPTRLRRNRGRDRTHSAES